MAKNDQTDDSQEPQEPILEEETSIETEPMAETEAKAETEPEAKETHSEHKKNHHDSETHESHEKHHEHKHQKHHEELKEEKKAESKDNEKKEIKDARISVAIFTLAGIAVGFLSSILKSSGVSNYITILMGILVLIALFYSMQKLMSRKGKLFLGDSFIYLFIWLVTWVFLYNA